MPLRQQNRPRTFKIGLATIISLILLYFGINFLKGANIFEKTHTYYMIFENSGGIEPSSQVVLNGFKVGKVSKLEFDYTGLGATKVKLDLNRHLQLPKGTNGVITNSLMGGATIMLRVPSDRSQGLIEPGDTIPSSPSGSDIFAKVQDDIVPNVASVSAQLDTLLVGLNKLVNSPQIPVAMDALTASSQSIRATTAQLNALMYQRMPIIMDNLDTTSKSISATSQKISKVEFEAALEDFTRVVADLKKVSGQLNSKDNSLGLLLNDPELYEQLSRASQSADSLLVDIRNNPKRYVHFSVF